MRIRFRSGLAALGVLAATVSLVASTPTFWVVSTQADFLKGDVENLSIDSDGRVFLGPAAAQIADTSAPFLWTLLPGTAGTLWAGTGNEGQVLRVAADGKRRSSSRRRMGMRWPTPGGGLYVGTSPDGRSTRWPPTARRSLFRSR